MDNESTVIVAVVPNSNNDGQPYPEQVFHDYEAELALELGGCMRMDDRPGIWAHKGIVYRDINRRYMVSTWRALVPEFERIHTALGQRLGQLAMFWYEDAHITPYFIDIENLSAQGKKAA